MGEGLEVVGFGDVGRMGLLVGMGVGVDGGNVLGRLMWGVMIMRMRVWMGRESIGLEREVGGNGGGLKGGGMVG